MPGITVRFTDAELALIRAHYRETYPAHGLSLNAWLVRRLVRRLRPQKKETPLGMHIDA